MRKLQVAVERWFQKQVGSGEDSAEAFDRMARELKVTAVVLIVGFLLVAFVSYLPIDAVHIAGGEYVRIRNFGGFVGALLAEGFLGGFGWSGFAVIAIQILLGIALVRGDSVTKHSLRILSGFVGMALLAMSQALLAPPEANPLSRGGYIGIHAGTWLARYLSTSGSMLFLLAGFFVLWIVSGGPAISTLVDALRREPEAEDTPEEKPLPRLRLITSAAATPAAPAVAKPKAKRAPRAKTEPTESEPTVDSILAEPSVLDTPAEAIPASAKPFEFRTLPTAPADGNIPTARLLKAADGSVKKLSRAEVKATGDLIVQHLQSFQITGEMTAVSQGPVLTTYEFKPAAGVKLSKIAALQEDLGVVLGTNQLRIVAPIPGKTVVGIEMPRPQSEAIPLKDLVSEDGFFDKKLRLPIAVGKTTDGQVIFSDLAAMPHLLVAGGTGSGKSVFVNSLIMSLLFRCSPKQLRLILVDPKMLELNVFDGLPHLVAPVITDNRLAFNALTWAVTEMERRYSLMAQTNSKNIDSYNTKVKGDDKLPYLVIIVDELADLMMSGGKDVEIAITRLAQKARAAGMHLVLATQRPSTDVVTGLIKANMPSRISFKVPSGIDSRTVLDTGGAEELLGRGDGLIVQPGSALRRFHACFVSEEELVRTVKFIRNGKNFSSLYLDFNGTNALDEKE